MKLKSNCIQLGSGEIVHEIVKLMVCYAKKKHYKGNRVKIFETEVEVKNGVIDVLADGIAYEIETNPTKEGIAKKQYYTQNDNVREVQVIDTSQFPPGYLTVVEELYKLVEERVLCP